MYFWHVMSLQLDCGIHPGLEGMDALPYIDLIDPAEIDLLLISQWVPFSKWKISSHWYLTICLSPLFLCQFSFGSLRSLAMVFTEDKFQREDFYDPCHQSHLPLVAFRLCESQVHQRSTFNKIALSIYIYIYIRTRSNILCDFLDSEATSQRMICCTPRLI